MRLWHPNGCLCCGQVAIRLTRIPDFVKEMFLAPPKALPKDIRSERLKIAILELLNG